VPQHSANSTPATHDEYDQSMSLALAITDRDLVYRRIDPIADGAIAFANYRETCIASFGDDRRCMEESRYLHWLGRRVEEFPEGHVFALLSGSVVGQLELQIPYGAERGYVNLFHVTQAWRRLGFGRRLHDFALRYFRSWDAEWIDLHVSPTNRGATSFYRSLGYRIANIEAGKNPMWHMERPVSH
jgi:ribosomal protein S18 acetylase RimI-like enzyme